MIDIKVTTCAPDWPWHRQFPNNKPELGPFKFHIDNDIDECDIWFVFESVSKTENVKCPPNRTIFITGEPDSIGHYSKSFLNQFHYVISSRKDLKHSNILSMQQGHPWFVEKTFDELINMAMPEKVKDICLLTSSKSFSEGHRERLKFVDLIKKRFDNKIDIYGRGINDFSSKWDVLAPYKYAIVLENYISENFITEKLPDAWLAFCIPYYAGCTNVSRYYSPEAHIGIDLKQPLESLEKIEEIFSITDCQYLNMVENVKKARIQYLLFEQFFAVLSRASQFVMSKPSLPSSYVQITPNLPNSGVLQKLKDFL